MDRSWGLGYVLFDIWLQQINMGESFRYSAEKQENNQSTQSFHIQYQLEQ